jgi:hypothetical protein
VTKQHKLEHDMKSRILAIVVVGCIASGAAAMAQGPDKANRISVRTQFISLVVEGAGEGYDEGVLTIGNGMEYLRYATIPSVGQIGFGVSLEQSWLQFHHEQNSIRVKETWLGVPIRYTVGNSRVRNPGSTLSVQADIVAYVGALLHQAAYVEPRQGAPSITVNAHDTFGYFKAGLMVELIFSFQVHENSDALIGFSFGHDLTAFGEDYSEWLQNRGRYFGISVGAAF